MADPGSTPPFSSGETALPRRVRLPRRQEGGAQGRWHRMVLADGDTDGRRRVADGLRTGRHGWSPGGTLRVERGHRAW